MPRKLFQVQVELDIQAVTCPGVWLCPNGKVSIQLYMLDSCIQTSDIEPVFPLLCHEKFLFCKIFEPANRLSDLQCLLRQESLYAELIQWKNYDIGYVLATFQTSLSELLYPKTYEGGIAGVDVDLLMEPSNNFPGIIAPKIEVSTRTTIDEVVCSKFHKRCSAFVINPKVIRSRSRSNRQVPMRQKKVCHSLGYHCSRSHQKNVKDNRKPTFRYRKPDDELLSRKPQGFYDEKDFCQCRCRDKSPSKSCPRFSRGHSGKRAKNTTSTAVACSCPCAGDGHVDAGCPVCSKYKHCFNIKCDMGRPCKAELRSLLLTPKVRYPRDPKQIQFVECGKCRCVPAETQTSCRNLHKETSTESEKDQEQSYLDEKHCILCRMQCNCENEPSLASAIHNRLDKTLQMVKDPLQYCRPYCGSFAVPECPKKEDCAPADFCSNQCSNFDDFYSKMFGRNGDDADNNRCPNPILPVCSW